MPAGGRNIGSFTRAPDRPLIGVLVAVLGVVALLPGWAGTMRPLGLACVPCFFIAWLYLRHAGLAALAALAPVPAIVGQFAVRSTPEAAAVFAASYDIAFVVALFVADGIALRVVRGASPETAARALLQAIAPALGSVIVAAVATLLALSLAVAHGSSGSVLQTAALADAVGCISAALGVSWGASLISFDEDFVVRANRARERRERFFYLVAQSPRMRFATSAACIVLALLFVGVFAILSFRVTGAGALALEAFGVISGLVGCLVALHDWRRALATAASLLPAIAIGTWGLSRLGMLPTYLMIGAALQILIAALALVVFASDRGLIFRNHIKSVASAPAYPTERKAVAATIVCVATGSVMAPLYVLAGAPALPFVFAILLVGLGVVVFEPAFAVGIETAIPRRVPLDCIYLKP